MLGSRISDFDAPSAGCGVVSWEKFVAPDQSVAAEQPNSATACQRRPESA